MAGLAIAVRDVISGLGSGWDRDVGERYALVGDSRSRD
jgi:hypothetical protein